MRKQAVYELNETRKTVSTPELMKMLGCGRSTALEIGTAAQARVQVGRRVLWNKAKVEKYINTISE